MLDSELRKRLVEHYDWDRAAGFIEVRTGNVSTEKPYSNPSQRWKRVLKQGTTAIDDLILLAETLPEDKRAELFTSERMTKFVEAILGSSLKNYTSTKMYELNQEKNQKANNEPDSKKSKEIAGVYNARASAVWKRYVVPLQKNLRITEISANISRLGLDYCSREYSQIELDPVLQAPITNALSTASQMTWSILAKMRVAQVSSNPESSSR